MADSTYSGIDYRLWQIPHLYGEGVHLLAEPFLITHLARLCSPETLQPRIYEHLEECYRRLLAAVIDDEFPRVEVSSATRMIEFTERGRYCGQIIDPATPVVTVNIARAGTFPSHVCFNMLNHLLDPAGVRQDHLVMERQVNESGAVTGASIYGRKIGGSVEGVQLIIPDPMGATGSSMVEALNFYRDEVDGTPARIVLMHVIVTPEYIRAVRESHPEAQIYAIRLDRGMSDEDVLRTVPGTHWDRETGLDDRQYIVPGGGGFGEILNNTKS